MCACVCVCACVRLINLGTQIFGYNTTGLCKEGVGREGKIAMIGKKGKVRSPGTQICSTGDRGARLFQKFRKFPPYFFFIRNKMILGFFYRMEEGGFGEMISRILKRFSPIKRKGIYKKDDF